MKTVTLSSQLPNFFVGMGRLFDFAGQLTQFAQVRRTSEAVDGDALFSDWCAVGNNLYFGMFKVRREEPKLRDALADVKHREPVVIYVRPGMVDKIRKHISGEKAHATDPVLRRIVTTVKTFAREDDHARVLFYDRVNCKVILINKGSKDRSDQAGDRLNSAETSNRTTVVLGHSTP